MFSSLHYLRHAGSRVAFLLLVRVLTLSVLLALAVCAAWGEEHAAPTALPKPQTGSGDLLVAPTRLLFEGKTRTASVTLINIGVATATYRISFIHQRMLEDGRIAMLKDGEQQPGELFADDLVRFTPRQVTLAPRESQTVRMQLRKPAELKDGEYRSHLFFHAVPQEEAHTPVPDGETASGLSVRLTPIFGVSIPVIVRQGQLSATAVLSDFAVVPPATAEQSPSLSLHIQRTGAQSTYGNLTVTYTPPGRKALEAGHIDGIAVYTPNPLRIVAVPLQLLAKGETVKGGRFTITYRAKPEDGGALLAEATYEAP